MERPTLASRRRACELGAQFIENDLARLRSSVSHAEAHAQRTQQPDAYTFATTSHEGDVMKAMEWASAATWLRAMAREEDR